MANTKVTGDVIANGTISTVHIADDAITAAKLDSTATGITFADLAVDTNTLYVDSANNRVGIGTTSPSVKLDTRLSSTTGKVAEFHNSVGYGIGFTVESDGGVNTINAESNQALAFATNGASNERMRIDSSGDLYIGGQTNYGKVTIEQGGDVSGLVINNTTAHRPRLYLRDAGGAGYSEILANNDLHLNASEVGIGVTSPSAKLDVAGSGKFQPGIADGDALVTIAQTNSNAYVHAGLKINAGNTNPFYIYQSGSSNTLRFNYNSLSDAGGQMVITSGGHVGIGNTSAPSPLTVSNNIDGTSMPLLVATGDGGMSIGQEVRIGFAQGPGSTFSSSASLGQLAFAYTGGSFKSDFIIKTNTTDQNDTEEKMRVTSIGNVGIGTTSPRGSSAERTIHLSDGGGGFATVYVTNNAETVRSIFGMQSSQNLGIVGTQTNTPFAIYTNDTERMRIKSSGDVEFKPANPVGMAGVDTNYLGFRITQTNDQSALLGTIYGQGVSGWGGRLVFRTKPDNGSPNDSTSIAMVINQDQYVGIGTTVPNQKLDVSGIVKQNGANNYENILVKSGSTGTFTFTYSELNSQMVDNVSYFIFVSVYRPTTDATNDTASLILHGIMPRGSNSTFNTINTLKGSGISVLTATNSGNSLVITTDSGTTFRCAIRIIAMGGTS